MKTLKDNIRKEIKQQLKNLSFAEKERQSDVIFNKLESSPDFQQANTVLLFWSLPEEVYTHNFIEKWADKKNILLPVIENNNLILKKFISTAKMTLGAFNIFEPTGNECKDYSTIDICIIPGMAFDKEGNRLGKGKGFYDKFLPKVNAKRIGVCFDFQLIEKIPSDSWDQKMDSVITSF